MRKIVAVGLGGVLAALALASSATPALHARPRVTVIGDSIITGLQYTQQARTLLGRNVDLRWQAAVCRRLVEQSCWYRGVRPDTVLDVIRANGDTLGDTVIVESGYNEYVQLYPDDIATVMAALKAAGVQTVLWITLRETRSTYATMNDQIRAAGANWPQLVVVDWNAVSRNRSSWFTDDGLHLNYDGAMGMARLLRTYVVKYACGGACRRLGPPD